MVFIAKLACEVLIQVFLNAGDDVFHLSSVPPSLTTQQPHDRFHIQDQAKSLPSTPLLARSCGCVFFLEKRAIQVQYLEREVDGGFLGLG